MMKIYSPIKLHYVPKKIPITRKIGIFFVILYIIVIGIGECKAGSQIDAAIKVYQAMIDDDFTDMAVQMAEETFMAMVPDKRLAREILADLQELESARELQNLEKELQAEGKLACPQAK